MKKRSYILALDCGTSSVRSIVFDLAGAPVSCVARSVKLEYPVPGYVQQNAEEIWTKQISAAYEAITSAEISAEEIAAIGITNQRETAVAWDKKTGQPLAPAIVWQCRRTAERCERLAGSPEMETIREKTGLVADPYFSATKFEWMLENVPGLRERAERGEVAFGTVDSWLLYRLSGGKVFATDLSNASRTMLCDIRAGKWDESLCSLFGIPVSTLCEIRPSSGLFCETEPNLLGAAIPVCGVAGDQQSALFGHACVEAGELKNTYGTGGFLLMNTGSAPKLDRKGGLLSTVAWQRNGEITYALEGSVFVCGAAVQWLRDGISIIRHSADSEELARSVPDCGGVYMVPAFTGLGAPYWDSSARGAILGITRGTQRGHIARATLEALAYQTVDVVREMERVTGERVRSLRVDGGAAANGLLMQIQADVLGVPVRRPEYAEITARGAAMLAALGVGAIASPGEFLAGEKISVFEPQISEERRREMLDGWHDAVRRVL